MLPRQKSRPAPAGDCSVSIKFSIIYRCAFLLFCKEHLRIVEMSLIFQYNRVKFAYKRKEMNRDDRNKKSHKKFDSFTAVDSLDLRIETGEFFSVCWDPTVPERPPRSVCFPLCSCPQRAKSSLTGRHLDATDRI